MDEDTFLDVIESGIKAARMEPEQLRAFRLALMKALDDNPISEKELKEMDHHTAWTRIDKALEDLMAGNDQLTDAELKSKSKRLKCLSDFAETLRLRVGERIKGQQVGDIAPLFKKFFEARNQVDLTTD